MDPSYCFKKCWKEYTSFLCIFFLLFFHLQNSIPASDWFVLLLSLRSQNQPPRHRNSKGMRLSVLCASSSSLFFLVTISASEGIFNCFLYFHRIKFLRYRSEEEMDVCAFFIFSIRALTLASEVTFSAFYASRASRFSVIVSIKC